MKNIRCLHPKWIIPVLPKGLVLTEHAFIMQDSIILKIIPSAQALTEFPQDQNTQHITLDHHALLPGFINLHAHSAMCLLRGIADDLPLMEWLNEHIWPAEKQHMSDQFVFDGTLQAMAEMIRGGTTTVNDMYFYDQAVARAGIASGMRTVVGCSILEFPTGYAENADGYLLKAQQAHSVFAGQAGLSFMLAPHAPYTVADETFKKILNLSDQLGSRIHCHIHETSTEITQSLSQYGMRPLARLHGLGILSEKLVAAHMVCTDPSEIELLSKTGVHIAHNPASNLKLASGFAQIHAMQNAGINIGIGTDGSASNNKLDLLADVRLAALLAKAQSDNASALNAASALEMATLSGARALGMQDSLGSLSAGKQADIIAIDLSNIETQPVFDPISQIVYAAGREQVSHVWVAGRCLMQNRELQTLDLEQIKDKAHWWQAKISKA